VQHNFDPGGGNRFPEADGRIARPQLGFLVENARLGRTRQIALNHDAGA
jgi:hypothetical protein